MAGHCYGPLDPVSNIILNTIWYDAAFPVPKEQHLDLDMIGRWALVRAERYSVAGLVAGLIAFAGDYNLSELQAIRCLLYTNGDFATAMSVLQQALLNQERTMLSDSELCRLMDVMANKRLELYSVMAIAAQHPSADGLLDFLVSERARAMLPRESRRFSREDVRSVIESLLQEPPPSLGMPSELRIYVGPLVSGCPGSGLGLPGTGWKGREVALAPWPKEKGGRKQKREEEEEEEKKKKKKKKKKKRSGKGRERKEKGIREKSGDFSGIFEIFKENLGY
ncbi:hypothetical protein OsI_33237 [Oryza sativa Indica Group]|uniref:PIR2-like helical domain-containing protein n=1 Tax=Oryza sativa subsp. indica TaxID=39946 RepID=B8BGG4_ORYSI|nr:hypothetical protein OsI_33237 [Oryza sativa Indica Group]